MKRIVPLGGFRRRVVKDLLEIDIEIFQNVWVTTRSLDGVKRLTYLPIVPGVVQDRWRLFFWLNTKIC